MRKSTRAQLADANAIIRSLKNERESVEFPLRRSLAEQERELVALRAEVATLRAEFRHLQLLAEYIGKRAALYAGPLASGKVMPVSKAPHFLDHDEIGRSP